MGETISSKNAVSKKSKTRKWDREEFLEALRGLIKARKDIDIYRVISYGGDRWGVLREGCKRMHKIHNDKQSAITHAKQLAQKSTKWEVIVHKKDATPEKYFYSYK